MQFEDWFWYWSTVNKKENFPITHQPKNISFKCPAWNKVSWSDKFQQQSHHDQRQKSAGEDRRFVGLACAFSIILWWIVLKWRSEGRQGERRNPQYQFLPQKGRILINVSLGLLQLFIGWQKTVYHKRRPITHKTWREAIEFAEEIWDDQSDGGISASLICRLHRIL